MDKRSNQIPLYNLNLNAQSGDKKHDFIIQIQKR
jgi:hypothetical protein